MSHQVTRSKPCFTKKSSLWHNKLLKVGKKTFYWKSWVEAGFIFIEDVFEDDDFMSFEQMMAEYKIPKKGLYIFN